MRKYIITSFVLLLPVHFVLAQEAEYRYDDAVQVWRLTDNAAALGIDSARNRGYAHFNVQHSEGDYTRVQQGGQQNLLSFYTERYQRLGQHLHAYGKFHFDMDRTKDRAWCDVLRPYDANPYFTGSSIPGKYDLQQFDLTAALGTTSIGHWHLGMRLDYKVADLSRLRDPRSRSQLLHYKLAPSATYTAGAHTLGLSLHYARRKEKIPGITLVNQNSHYVYYFMSGLENVSGVTDGQNSFNREWVDHRFGGQLSYQLHRHNLNSLTTASFERSAEDTWGTYKYEPGRYKAHRYGLSSHNRLAGGHLLHQLDVELQYEQAYADEQLQQLQQEREGKNTSYSYATLLVYKKRHQLKLFNLDLRYRAHFTAQQRQKGYAGLHLSTADSQTKHQLPGSEMRHGGTQLMAEGGLSMLRQRLWADVQAGGFLSQDASLSLGDPTTAYARQVLLPDMAYYRANYWRGRVELKYLFPLTIKSVRSQWYAKVYADYLRTNNHLSQQVVGLSIGIYN